MRDDQRQNTILLDFTVVFEPLDGGFWTSGYLTGQTYRIRHLHPSVPQPHGELRGQLFDLVKISYPPVIESFIFVSVSFNFNCSTYNFKFLSAVKIFGSLTVKTLANVETLPALFVASHMNRPSSFSLIPAIHNVQIPFS